VELVQWVHLPARQADWRDVLANALGAAIGIALVAGVSRMLGRRATGSRTVGQRE
jgi:VanZ family protein